MEILAFCLFVGISNASLTEFYFFCLGNPENNYLNGGRILSRIGRNYQDVFNNYEEKKKPNALNPYKILVCPYCYNVYPTLLSYFLLVDYSLSALSIAIFCLFTVGISHVSLAIIRNVTE